MRETFQNDFCDVCKLQGMKVMSQLIKNPPALYVAVPEVKKYIGDTEILQKNLLPLRQRIPPHMRAINMTGIAVY